ncbi:MAG: hypothetical protein JXO51_10120 [Candidatus Aminicenantes bacterium]|nr:hypothetical protein [Candidatus Aminicenantes bacterium]
MVCDHLRELERALQEGGFAETCRGRVWTRNCREWVYFEVVLYIDGIRERFALAPCVRMHENLDPKSGTERGLFCEECHDGIMGRLDGAPRFP